MHIYEIFDFKPFFPCERKNTKKTCSAPGNMETRFSGATDMPSKLLTVLFYSVVVFYSTRPSQPPRRRSICSWAPLGSSLSGSPTTDVAISTTALRPGGPGGGDCNQTPYIALAIFFFRTPTSWPLSYNPLILFNVFSAIGRKEAAVNILLPK